MADGSETRRGFSDVDAMPDPGILVAGMDATAQWPAVRALRAWERTRLQAAAGEALLDVGCGAGDVIIDLARAVGPTGRAVGIDFSAQMLAAAADRAATAGVDVSFSQGDAMRLEEADDSFDVVRSERTLQWVDEPADAVAEMVRVARPGARISIIDSDWRTLIVEPSGEATKAFLDALATTRGESIAVGGRLLNLLRSAGVRDLGVEAATHLWTRWDPDTEPTPQGFIPLRMVADTLVAQGALTPEAADESVSGLEEAARAGRFFMSLTMFAAAGAAP